MNNDYPINLLDSIASAKKTRNEEAYWDYPLPPDLLPSVEYAVALLSEKEERIVHMRYRYGMGYDEIGKEFNVTRERIRQIIAKAIRKLSHPSRLCWLINGVQGEIANRVAKAKENAVSNKLNAVVSDITKIMQSLDDITGNEVFKNAASEYKIYGYNPLIETSISELDLSVRSFNCLTRQNVKTLRDLTGLTLDELTQIRNLGKHSYEEIVEKVHQMGLHFKGETDAEE